MAATVNHSCMPPLRCACLIDQRDDTLLLVRVRQNEHWYLPGGKIEPHETADAALIRELREELDIELLPDSIRYLYTVTGPAYGQPGNVELICFSATWRGELHPLGEVSEACWLDHRDTVKFAPAVKILCEKHLAPGVLPKP